MIPAGHWTIEGLFEGKSGALALFDMVRRYIESLGSVTVEPARTQVSFGAKRKFAWVWLPQIWIKEQLQDSIVLTIGLDRKIDSRSIKQVIQPYPGRWVHHIVIEKDTDFDDDVKGWLQEAYYFGLKTRRSGGKS